MTIQEMRKCFGDTQSAFAKRYQIPFRTIQNWESGLRTPPDYVLSLLEQRVKADLVNRKTVTLPKKSADKLNLPKRSDYIGPKAWLRALSKELGSSTVFALDQALMCDGSFLGRDDEYLVWVYGDDSLTKYNGVVVLGNSIQPCDVQESNGLRFTRFERTLDDAIANEDILDMQGITEALSRYYYSHNESFQNIRTSPEHQQRFQELAADAMDCYSS